MIAFILLSMVELNRIYTRTGDGGQTRLADGSQVAKDDLRVQAYGAVDEANAALGMVAGTALPETIAKELSRIQNDCFDLGSDLATPPGGPWEDKIPRIIPAQVTRLEAVIDLANQDLPALTSFILPGGSPAASWLHVARTVVRRAERDAWACQRALQAAGEPRLNSHALHYLNRLSDLCFVWARLVNDGGARDVLWQPGQNR